MEVLSERQDHSQNFGSIRGRIRHENGQTLVSYVAGLKPKYRRVVFDIGVGYLFLLAPFMILPVIAALSLAAQVAVVVLMSCWCGFWLAYLHLFLHEAAHFNIAPEKQANDLYSNLLIGWIVFQPIKNYRAVHQQHHRHFGTPQDTETTYRNELTALFLIRSLTGLEVLRTLRRRRASALAQPPRSNWLWFFLGLNLCFYALLSSALGVTALAVWILAQFSWMPFWGALRQLLEHRATAQGGATTRNFENGIFSSFFGGAGFRLHLLHHWEPSVSYTRLDELRAFLTSTPLNEICETQTETYLAAFGKTWKK